MPESEVQAAPLPDAVRSPEGEKRTHLTPARAHILTAAALNDPAMLHPDSRITDAQEKQVAPGLQHKDTMIDFMPLLGLTIESRSKHYESHEEKDIGNLHETWVNDTQKWIDWAVTHREGFKEAMTSLGFQESDMKDAAKLFYDRYLDTARGKGALTEELLYQNIAQGLNDFAETVFAACKDESGGINIDKAVKTLDALSPMLQSFGIEFEADKRVADYIISEALLDQKNVSEMAGELRDQLPVETEETRKSLERLALHAGVDKSHSAEVTPSSNLSPEPAPARSPEPPPSPEDSVFNRAKLEAVLAEKPFSPQKLIEFFKTRFAEEYAADSGVWEGYSLERHTEMILQQYDKYFAGRQQFPSPMNENLFRVILALHDIGKPEAVAAGDRGRQHEFTIPKMKQALTDLGYTPAEIKFAIALVDNDFLGKLVDNERDFAGTVEGIKQKAAEAGIPLQEFFDTLRTYYAVDSSSYTVDAGGEKSLDENFEFDHDKGGKRELKFAPRIEDVFSQLREALASPQDEDAAAIARGDKFLDDTPPLKDKELEFALEWVFDTYQGRRRITTLPGFFSNFRKKVDTAEIREHLQRWPLERNIVRELQDIFTDEKVKKNLLGRKYTYRTTMTKMLKDLGLGEEAKDRDVSSGGWFLWGVARERFFATHPDVKKASLMEGEAFVPSEDPTTYLDRERHTLPEAESVNLDKLLDKIMHRELEYEVRDSVRNKTYTREQFFAHLSPNISEEHKRELEEFLELSKREFYNISDAQQEHIGYLIELYLAKK